jgi:hypothetical protein
MVYRPPTHGILTPLTMVYRPPYPWYIDPPTHGISTPLPMVYRPPYLLKRRKQVNLCLYRAAKPILRKISDSWYTNFEIMKILLFFEIFDILKLKLF